MQAVARVVQAQHRKPFAAYKRHPVAWATLAAARLVLSTATAAALLAGSAVTVSAAATLLFKAEAVAQVRGR